MPRNITVVADLFLEDFNGGSERSLEAILQASPVPLKRTHCKEFNPSLNIKENFYIFGNFWNINQHADRFRKLNYVVIESDFKYCRYRLPELHEFKEGRCTCPTSVFSKPVIEFYKHAKAIFWKSRRHLERHLLAVPELAALNNIVLSITYTPEDLKFLSDLAQSRTNKWGLFRPKTYAVYKSQNWIKGYDDAIKYCKENKLKVVELGSLENREFLQKLSQCYGLVFLPRGVESCSRMAVEAKILGLDVIINSNVGAGGDDFYNLPRPEMLEFIASRTKLFWNEIGKVVPLEDFTCPA